MFRCIPLFRGCNRQVEYIDKRHCRLAHVPDDVLRYARTLEDLLLDANNIRDLPRGLFRLVKLRKLCLSDNEICRLPPDIANLVNLVELDVSRNSIPDIPENVKFLKSLQIADFSSNPMTKLPQGFVQLRNLTVLGLNDVSLAQLPHDFGSLTSLQSLELRENMLKTLPPSFSFLVRLERLDLGSNGFEELPPLIGQLSSLQELWLDFNDLVELPNEIGNLKKLACLDVSENRLEHLPDEIAGCENLTDLHLSQNCLEALPDGIGCLRKLTIFKVDQNRLLALTAEIGRCTNLQELILTENLLSELPSSIGSLINLTNLNIDRNRLSELPPEVGNLTKLGVLSLRDNHLSYLPTETGKLQALHVLDVSGNRLQHLPMSVTALNLKALWLAENQSQPMLKFQTDIDERSGANVLTCFLLPQQEYHPESMENLLRDSVEQDSRLSWEQKTADRTSAVKFAEESDAEDKEDKETQFVRHDTPHPRELKARHTKLFTFKTKNIDGHVVMHDEEKENGVECFRPQRSSTGSISSSSSDAGTAIIKGSPEVRREHIIGDHVHSTVTDSKMASDSLGKVQLNRISEFNGANGPLTHLLSKEEDGKTSSEEEQDNEVRPRRVASILAQALAKDSNSDVLPPPPPSPPQASHSGADSENERTDSPSTVGEISLAQGDIIEERMEFFMERKNTGLGLSIAGGKGSTPYKGNDEGIFISRITEGGPANMAGLKIGDKIISVNNTLVIDVDHYEAVNTLKAAGDKLTLVVLREVRKDKPQNALLDKETPLLVPESQQVNPPLSVLEEIPTSQKRPLQVPNKVVEAAVDHQSEKVPNDKPKPAILTVPVPGDRGDYTQVPSLPPTPEPRTPEPEFEMKREIIFTTLIRDQNGLGFSIAGGLGGTPYKDGNEGIYISRIAEGGAADKDNKLRVGDKVLTINGVDMDSARHDHAVAMLTGLDRFVRLVVQREQVTLKDPNAPKEPQKLPLLSDKSPRLIGMPRPYTSLYSSTSYMANRPSYLGSYRRPILSSTSSDIGDKPTFSIYTKLPGLRNEPFTSATSIATSPAPVTSHSYHYSTSPIANTTLMYMPSQPISSVPDPQPVGLPNVYPAYRTEESRTVLHSHGHAQPPPLVNHVGALPSEIGVSHSAHHSYNAVPNAGSLVASTPTVPSAKPKGPLVTVTIQQAEPYVPLGDSFPPPPKTLGTVTEVLTKSTFTETTTTRVTNNTLALPPCQVEEITLVKAGGPLGLSIIGGSDHSCHPFGEEEHGIFISKVVPDGTAAKTEKLCVGDRLLKVNGVDISTATHQEAVMALLAPTYEMTLTVRHQPLPKGWQEVTIRKQPDEKLGMNIKGGAHGHPGNPFDKEDEGVFISRINPDGAVYQDGRLEVGTRIIEVNGVSLLGASHQEAVNALRNAGDVICLLVCDGYDPSNAEPELGAGDTLRLNMKASQSLSSIDREGEDSAVIKQEQETLHETAQWEKEDQEKLENLRKERSRETLDTTGVAVLSDRSVVSLADSPVSCQELIPHNEKSVDQKVLDVVRAAEQLVKPLSKSTESVASAGSTPPKDQKTTTIFMTKHSVSQPQTSTPVASHQNPFDYTPPSTPSPSLLGPTTPILQSGEPELDSSTDSLLDPIGFSRLPGAKPSSTASNKPTKPAPSLFEPEQLTFSEKKRRFEQGSQQPPQSEPTIDLKRFSYLSQDEVDRLKEEEAKKIASMTEEQLQSYRALEEDEDYGLDDNVADEQDWNESPVPVMSVDEDTSSKKQPEVATEGIAAASMPLVRTAKAERRLQEKMKRDGLDMTETEVANLTPAQQRALQAEKRAAWRQARLKSLEEDAVQAQMVLTQVKEMAEAMESRTGSPPLQQHVTTEDSVTDLDVKVTVSSGAECTEDLQDAWHNGEPDKVETTVEKIMSLELVDDQDNLAENGLEEDVDDEAENCTELLSPTACVVDAQPVDMSTSPSKKRKKKKAKKR